MIRALLLLVCFWLPGYAQEVEATLVGSVLSLTSIALSNCQITLTNNETGIARQAITDSEGNFSIRFLTPAAYSLRVEKADYQPGVYDNFLLRPGQIFRLDFQLRPTKEVRDQTGPSYTWLQTDTPAVRRLVEQRNIRDLPLNGRNFIQLVQLLPGVFPATPGSQTASEGRASLGESSPQLGLTAIAANGFRDTANRFFLDGVEFLDFETSSFPFSPSIDSLSEVKVETSTYSARYGFAAGAQVDMVTRSGGTSYHGTLWAFNRNDYFSQSRDAIAGESVAAQRLNRNQYGVNFGGPVQVPRLFSPEATSFFFVNWEGGSLREGVLSQPLRVLTTAQREGDFSQLVNARDGSPILLRDPLGVGLLPNRVPASLISPQARAFLNFVPSPNFDSTPFNFLPGSQKGRANQNNGTGRLDQRFRTDNLFTARYSFNQTYSRSAPVWGNDDRRNEARGQNALGQYTRSFGPRRVNQLRVGWNRLRDSESYGTSGQSGFDFGSALNLPQLSRRSEDFGPPTVRVDGPEGQFNFFSLPRVGGPRFRSNDTYQVSNVLAWQRGPHMLRAGGDFFYKLDSLTTARNPRGTFRFDGAYTGSALADFLLGYTRAAELAPTRTASRLQASWAALFIQDDWRVRPGLSINLGMRWDYVQPFAESRGEMLNIEHSGFSLTQAVRSGDSRFGRRMRETSPTNFGPRFGLAWSPPQLPGLVVRLGYGMYFSPHLPETSFRMSEAAQDSLATAAIGSAAIPDLLLSNPFPNLSTSGVSSLAVSVDPYLKDSYAHHWNLSIQRKVLFNFLLDAGYVGSKGTRLPITLDDLNRPVNVADPRDPNLLPLNQRRPHPDFPRAVLGEKSIGNSNYHSLQTSAFRSSPSGLELVLAYTWSKCLSGPGDAGGMIPHGTYIGRPQDLYNLRADRSLCGFDRAHRFTGSALYETRVRGPVPLFKWLLDGWRIAAIPTLSSGPPAGITYNVDTTATGLFSRPDLVPGSRGNLPGSQRTYARWFNTDAFSPTPFGRFGTTPRTGAIRLPGVSNLDVSFARAFNLTDFRKFEFRAEIFNATNRFNPNPSLVDLNLQSVSFGSIGGGIQGLTTRVVQFGIKLSL